MRDALGLCIPHFPTTDEQIEGEIVDPTGQQQPAVLKQRGYTVEGAEVAVAFS